MKNFKRITVLFLLLLLMLPDGGALADVPYYTLTIGADGELVETQTAYEPVASYMNFGGETVKKPNDLFYGPDGNLYIADTGNKRILVVSTEGELVKIIGSKKELYTPSGVFVDDALNVYVADERKGVVVYDAQGEVIATYLKPEHPMFGEKAYFKPNKIAVDKRGTMYIISAGNPNGIIKITREGEFLGYFGANTTYVAVSTMIKMLFYSGEQFDTSVLGRIPVAVDNICIDSKGLIYAVSVLQRSGSTLRRLNVSGSNTFKPEYVIQEPLYVTTSSDGFVYVANGDGEIMELTSDGKLLFLTTAKMYMDIRKGLYKSIAGLAVDEQQNIYVLDRTLGNIQVLAPTEFAGMVHQAYTLFQDGKYLASKELWEDVQRMNSLFSYASVGLAEAFYREENYTAAMEQFRIGGDKEGYSDAYWEVRADWLHHHLGDWLLGILVVLVLWKALILLQKKTGVFQFAVDAGSWIGRIPLVQQLAYTVHILRDPADTSYGIKREKKASILSATIVLLVFFAVYVGQKYLSGFLFKTVRDGVYELALDAELIAMLFGLVTVCFYLVCTVREGEAKLRDLYIGFAYALMPVIVLCPIATVLSNVLTNNEAFLITLLQFVAYAWTGVLCVLMLMFLNDFSFKKTVVIIFWSVFTLLVVVAVAFIVIVLLNQLWEFVQAIYGEVVYRIVGTI